MIRRFPLLRSAEELASLINEIGFLPFFANAIPGFSIEESTPGELWFSDGADGPWEWKGPAIDKANCAYGKFFQNKAMYISLDWFPDFANYRRDGYDFEGFYEEGFARSQDKKIIDALNLGGPMLSKALKRVSGHAGKDGIKGFDGALTRLQMQTFLLTDGIEYATDRFGNPYGWGICRYATPEQRYGENCFADVYELPPEKSKQKLLAHLRKLLPDADDDALMRVIGKPATNR